MPIVNTKATSITNADATKVIRNDAYFIKTHLKEDTGTLEKGAGDSNNSVYRFARVKSNVRISAINLLNDAITGGTAYSCGVYETAANGAAVVSIALFASGVDLSSARAAPLDIRHQASDINTVEKRLWELLGLDKDPNKEYDICLTGVTAGGGAGTITLKVQYAAGV